MTVKDKIVYRYKPNHLAPDEFIAGMPKRDILESDLPNLAPSALRDATAPNTRTGKPAYEAEDEEERAAQLAAIEAGVQVAQVVAPRDDTFTPPSTTALVDVTPPNPQAMTRPELNTFAAAHGVPDPAGFPNKEALLTALEGDAGSTSTTDDQPEHPNA